MDNDCVADVGLIDAEADAKAKAALTTGNALTDGSMGTTCDSRDATASTFALWADSSIGVVFNTDAACAFSNCDNANASASTFAFLAAGSMGCGTFVFTVGTVAVAIVAVCTVGVCTVGLGRVGATIGVVGSSRGCLRPAYVVAVAVAVSVLSAGAAVCLVSVGRTRDRTVLLVYVVVVHPFAVIAATTSEPSVSLAT